MKKLLLRTVFIFMGLLIASYLMAQDLPSVNGQVTDHLKKPAVAVSVVLMAR
jgi:hypothetical protein